MSMPTDAPSIPKVKVRSDSGEKFFNIYWGINYSLLDINKAIRISVVNSVELETDKRKYRVMHVKSYDDLCRHLADIEKPIADVVIINDDFKLYTSKEVALLDENSAERKQAKEFQEGISDNEEKVGFFSKLYRKFFGKKRETKKPYNPSKLALDYLALRLSDPKKYCDGVFKSVTEEASELSRLVSNSNPDAKLVIVNQGLNGVRSADKTHWENMIGLYNEIIREIPNKYNNVHIFDIISTLFFNDQYVRPSLKAIDDLLDG
jgi:hypothetical protein